jgi:salicylate hydroxylase
MGSGTATPTPEIAIIGAGIGGLALAIGLLRQNIPFMLYEAAPAYSTVGAGVGLGPNALRAMDLLDTRFRSLYNAISTGNLTPHKEHVMMDAYLLEPGLGTASGWTGKAFGAKSYERTSAHRRDLLDIMTGLIPLSRVRFGKKAKSMEGEGGRVKVLFEDGEEVCVAAVVGCDGVKGASRAVVLADKWPGEVEASYAGKYAYRAIVPMQEALGILGPLAGDANMFMGKGRNITTFPISKGQECNVVAFKVDQEKEWTHKEWTRMVSREKMLEDFEGVDKRILKLMDVRPSQSFLNTSFSRVFTDA